MILGDVCTRSCRFCDVPSGHQTARPREPDRVANLLAGLGLRHAVITCVNRDDLDDGAQPTGCHPPRGQATLSGSSPGSLDRRFAGDLAAVDQVLDAGPDVFAHNLETVPRWRARFAFRPSIPAPMRCLPMPAGAGSWQDRPDAGWAKLWTR